MNGTKDGGKIDSARRGRISPLASRKRLEAVRASGPMLTPSSALGTWFEGIKNVCARD